VCHDDAVTRLTGDAGALVRQPLAEKATAQMQTTEEYRRLEQLHQEVAIASRRKAANEAAADECEARKRRAVAELAAGWPGIVRECDAQRKAHEQEVAAAVMDLLVLNDELTRARQAADKKLASVTSTVGQEVREEHQQRRDAVLAELTAVVGPILD